VGDVDNKLVLSEEEFVSCVPNLHLHESTVYQELLLTPLPEELAHPVHPCSDLIAPLSKPCSQAYPAFDLCWQ